MTFSTARRRRRIGIAGSVAFLALAVVSPAHAHLAIRLDIYAPEAGQHVARNTDVVVFAQPTLAGVDHTSFAVLLDGRPIDPATGRHTRDTVVTQIRVSTTRRVPLRGLRAGAHRISLSYRPDVDAPTRTTAVEFVVRTKKSRTPLLIGLGFAGAVVFIGAAAVVRRART